MEIEYHFVVARFHVDGTEDIIHTSQFYRLTIYGSSPSRIVNLREDDDATLARLHLVGEVVWLILDHLHHRSIILLHALSQLLLEHSISHSHMTEVDLAHAINLLVGIVDILHLIHKPGIAVGVWILYRNRLTALQRQDEVFGIEHVQYREDTVAIYLGHITTCLSHSLHRLLHLRSDMCINHLLIATELGRMITADALVVIRGLVLIEGIGSEIEHTVIERLVAADNLIGLRHLLRSIAHVLIYEHIIVEITLVHHPHIYETEYGDAGNHILSTQLLHLVKQQEC